MNDYHIYTNCSDGSTERTPCVAASLATAIAVAILGQPPFGCRHGGRIVCDGKVVFEF
jgi:hypothetical protein